MTDGFYGDELSLHLLKLIFLFPYYVSKIDNI